MALSTKCLLLMENRCMMMRNKRLQTKLLCMQTPGFFCALSTGLCLVGLLRLYYTETCGTANVAHLLIGIGLFNVAGWLALDNERKNSNV